MVLSIKGQVGQVGLARKCSMKVMENMTMRPRLSIEEGRSRKSWWTDKHLNVNTNGVRRKSKGKSMRTRERKKKQQRRDS